jgi:hypothetical protein
MVKTILGLLTLSGLIVIVVAIIARYQEMAYPGPITLLYLGAGCSLLAGIPWAHTRGKRGLKSAFLGLVGFVGGTTLGFFLGLRDLDLLIACFWIGGILFACLGVWWGIRFHRWKAKRGSAPARRPR